MLKSEVMASTAQAWLERADINAHISPEEAGLYAQIGAGFATLAQYHLQRELAFARITFVGGDEKPKLHADSVTWRDVRRDETEEG